MRGWILDGKPVPDPSLEGYEVRRFLEVGERVGIDVDLVTPEQLDLVVTSSGRPSIARNGRSVPLPDFLLPRMGAYTTYFGLAVIRHLERLGVLTVNSAESIDTVKDKLFTHQILAQNELPIARTMLAKHPLDVAFVEKEIGFPVVVKTITGSQGAGVFLCEDRHHFEDLMELVLAARSNANLILQEYVASSRGRDLRVFTVGGRAVAAMERSSQDGSFKANVSRGGRATAYSLDAESEWLALEVTRLLGLDVAGIDLLFDGDHYLVCEANSSPGFRGLESCCAVSIPHEILRFAALRLGRHDVADRLEVDLAESFGDPPVGVASTWSNAHCAVSASGTSDAERALAEVGAVKGQGGCMAIDGRGRITTVLNSPQMVRASLVEGEPMRLGIWTDDDA